MLNWWCITYPVGFKRLMHKLNVKKLMFYELNVQKENSAQALASFWLKIYRAVTQKKCVQFNNFIFYALGEISSLEMIRTKTILCYFHSYSDLRDDQKGRCVSMHSDIYFHYYNQQIFFFAVALQPNACHDLLILEVSRSHTTTHHSRQYSSGRVISSSQIPLPDNTQHLQHTNIHAPGGIRNHDLSRPAAADLRLRPRGHWDRQPINTRRLKGCQPLDSQDT